MKFIKLSNTCYYFSSAVNVGYVHQGSEGLLIDAGLEAQTIKKIIKQLQAESLPLTHLFITHAHADHYGGAAFLQKNYDVHTIAPKWEEAVLTYPSLEPQYLFQGTSPLPSMRSKFLEGEPVRIDQIVEEGDLRIGNFKAACVALPGHSEYQLGLLINDCLYAADAYFGEEQLHKHKIPYVTNVEEVLNSLHHLLEITCKGAVPGHGTYEEDFKKTVSINMGYHMQVLENMMTVLKKNSDGVSQESLIHEMCQLYGINISTVTSWMLFRTAITAYAVHLVKLEKANFFIEKSSLWIKSID